MTRNINIAFQIQTPWTQESYTTTVFLDKISLKKDTPPVEAAILAFLLSCGVDHYGSVNNFEIFSSFMNIAQKPHQMTTDKTLPIHAHIIFKSCSIHIESTGLLGDAWVSVLDSDFSTTIACIKGNHLVNEAFFKSITLDDARIEEEELLDNITFEHALGASVVDYALRHDVEIAYQYLMDYVVHTASKARRDCIDIKTSPSHDNFLDLRSLFTAKFISWKEIVRSNRIIADTNFERYLDHFPKHWREIGAHLAPLAFKIPPAVLGPLTMVRIRGQSRPTLNDLDLSISGHDIMTLKSIEKQIVDIIQGHRDLISNTIQPQKAAVS